MQNLIFNGQSYDMEQLPSEVKAQVQSLQFVDAELSRLNASIAVLQTARAAYLNALNRLLSTESDKKITLQ